LPPVDCLSNWVENQRSARRGVRLGSEIGQVRISRGSRTTSGVRSHPDSRRKSRRKVLSHLLVSRVFGRVWFETNRAPRLRGVLSVRAPSVRKKPDLSANEPSQSELAVSIAKNREFGDRQIASAIQ